MVCTFFGHRNTPIEIRDKLKDVLRDLIENHQANMFYVGNQGSFDSMVKGVLQSLKAEYPHIKYAVVLPYMPTENAMCDDLSDTIYPEGLEKTPPKYAISKRNKWLVEKSDTVVTYVAHSWGGAAQYKELAEKKKKTVINLYK